MSLPDTVFIFVLALIIFGPKKLPEIGRQVGRLVGEFRRASNEFKFQIEEELRQMDLNETRSERQTIATPKAASTTADPLPPSSVPIPPVAEPTVSETLPVGQHPNIDNFNASHLKDADFDPDATKATSESPADENFKSDAPVPFPAVTAAAGSEPRATAPHANGDESGFASWVKTEVNGNGGFEQTHVPEVEELPSTATIEDAAPHREQDGIEPVVAHADVGHG